jgi:F420-dependent methylenetetrahydromethanopterin dehydrogenase
MQNIPSLILENNPRIKELKRECRERQLLYILINYESSLSVTGEIADDVALDEYVTSVHTEPTIAVSSTHLCFLIPVKHMLVIDALCACEN